MLAYTLERAPNVAGVVFELLDEHLAKIGMHAIADEVMHARRLWERFHICQPQAA